MEVTNGSRRVDKAKVHTVNIFQLCDYIHAGNTVYIDSESGRYVMSRMFMYEYCKSCNLEICNGVFTDFARSVSDVRFDTNISFISAITNIIRETGADVQRGDIIDMTFCPEYGYRNNGKVIYNGSILEPLSYLYDEYGAVPTSYITLHPFPIGYFCDAVVHNCIHTFIYDDIKEELLKNKTVGEYEEVTYFTVNDERYYITTKNLGEVMGLLIVIDVIPDEHDKTHPGYILLLDRLE